MAESAPVVSSERQPAAAPVFPSAEVHSPTTKEEAEGDFANAEKALTRLVGGSSPMAPQGKAERRSADDCGLANRALDSMRNATTHLCELDSQDRCDDAKARLDRAAARVQEACSSNPT